MSANLPIRSPPTSSPASRRNQDSRNYFTNYSAGAEAINGPVREEGMGTAGAADRLIVGVDFGTTFSGWVGPPLAL